MPTIEENKYTWDIAHDWSKKRDSWSESWGGVDMQWHASILFRIHAFIPSGTILEIAPGFGRWTQFLVKNCKKLILVDLSKKCIQACKQRFKSHNNITYYVNDGQSLDMLEDESIDFVFSFDSLVHVEQDVIRSYLGYLGKKLKKNGVGFVHHSNIKEYSNYFSFLKKLPKGNIRKLLNKFKLTDWTNGGNRAFSMSARLFAQYAADAGMQCISQELINWVGTNRLIDCISIFTRKDSIWVRPNKVVRNNNFMKEAKNILRLSQLYGAVSFDKQRC